MKLALYFFASYLGVLNMILWGLYGDLMVERFEIKKVLRSFLFATIGAIFLFLDNAGLPLIIISLGAISFERAFSEIYTGFLRTEDQEKYFIPSDLNIKNNYVRKFLGFIFIALIPLIFFNMSANINNYLSIAIAGLIVAISGMTKDAPFEGFRLFKFFRSPIFTLVAGLIIIHFFPILPSKNLMLAAVGMERIFSEFYKKIYNRKIPSKFRKNLKKSKYWSKNRDKIIFPIYAIDLFILAILLVSGV